MKKNSEINIRKEIIGYIRQSSKKRLLQFLTEHQKNITQEDIEGIFTIDGKVVNLFQYAIYKNYPLLAQFLIDKFPGSEKHCLLYLVQCKKDFSFNRYYANWISLFSTYTLDSEEKNELFKTYLPYFKRNRHGNSDSYRWYAGLVEILLNNLQYPFSVNLQVNKYSTIEFFEKELRELFSKQQDFRADTSLFILDSILSQSTPYQVEKDAEKQTKCWKAVLNAILIGIDYAVDSNIDFIWGDTLKQIESLLNMANKIIKGMYFDERLDAEIDFSPYNASALKIFKKIGLDNISMQVTKRTEGVPHSKDGSFGSFVPMNLVMPVELTLFLAKFYEGPGNNISYSIQLYKKALQVAKPKSDEAIKLDYYLNRACLLQAEKWKEGIFLAKIDLFFQSLKQIMQYYPKSGDLISEDSDILRCLNNLSKQYPQIADIVFNYYSDLQDDFLSAVWFFERHLPASKHPEYSLRHKFLNLIKKYLDERIPYNQYITGLKDIVEKNGFHLAKRLLAKHYNESPRQSEKKDVAYYNKTLSTSLLQGINQTVQEKLNKLTIDPVTLEREVKQVLRDETNKPLEKKTEGVVKESQASSLAIIGDNPDLSETSTSESEKNLASNKIAGFMPAASEQPMALDSVMSVGQRALNSLEEQMHSFERKWKRKLQQDAIAAKEAKEFDEPEREVVIPTIPSLTLAEEEADTFWLNLTKKSKQTNSVINPAHEIKLEPSTLFFSLAAAKETLQPSKGEAENLVKKTSYSSGFFAVKATQPVAVAPPTTEELEQRLQRLKERPEGAEKIEQANEPRVRVLALAQKS